LIANSHRPQQQLILQNLTIFDMHLLLTILVQADTLSQEVDLIQKIDSLYNNAWNKLVIVGSVAFAIVGIIVPLVIQWYQRRTLKLSEELMKKEIAENAEEKKEEIINVISEEIEAKFQSYEKQLKMANASSNAKIFFAQGKFNLEKNYFPVALNEFITASYSCIECEDYQTLQKLLQAILHDCLPNLSIEEINDLKIANVGDLNSFLEHLTKVDDRDIFQETIGDIKVKMTKLPKNIRDKPSEQSKKQDT